MIYDHFRATGAYEAVQGLSNLFITSLQNQALLSASETPTDVILEGLYMSKLQDPAQLQAVLAWYDQETVLKPCTNKLFTIEDVCKVHYDQMMRTRKQPSVKKEGKPTLRGKWKGRVFSVEGEAVVRDEKDDRLLPHQIRRRRLTVKKATDMKVLTKEVRFCADTKIVQKKKTSCKFLASSLNPDAHMAINPDFDLLRQRKIPAKKSKKGGAKGSVALLKESQDSYSRKFSSREKGKLGSKHAVKFSQAPGTK